MTSNEHAGKSSECEERGETDPARRYGQAPFRLGCDCRIVQLRRYGWIACVLRMQVVEAKPDAMLDLSVAQIVKIALLTA